MTQIILVKRTLCYLAGFLFLLAGCNQAEEAIPSRAYIRVLDLRSQVLREDLQFGKVYLSAFTWDGSFYGNPGLDSVQKPMKALPEFGDFLLGRAFEVDDFFEIEGVPVTADFDSYFGAIDYVGIQPYDAESVDLQPYRQGANAGRRGGRGLYFPNLSHRVDVAPVFNGIDYYKWAAFAPGSHQVGFRSVEGKVSIRTTTFPPIVNEYEFLPEDFVPQTPYYFQPNGIYSLMLVSTDIRSTTQASLLRIQEDENFNPDPSKAYIRFINAIPLTGEAGADALTESVDIYMRQVDNGELDKLEKDTITYDIRYLKTITPEKLVASDLRRFEVQGQLPYIELDYNTYFSREDTSAAAAVGEGVATYVFYMYPHGGSQATGAIPLRPYQFILSSIGRSLISVDNSGLVNVGYIPVLAKGANGYVPTISTVILGTQAPYVGGSYYNLEQTSVRQAYLDKYNRGR